VRTRFDRSLAAAAGTALLATTALAQASAITRLTPPSQLFASGGASGEPVISRFAPGQRFDLQATVRPDPNTTITSVSFAVDGRNVKNSSVDLQSTGLVAGLPAGTTIASLRAYSSARPGIHTLTVVARQSDGQVDQASGNFEIVPVAPVGRRVKSVIIMLGDGMGASHRTAARIMLKGYTQGKANGRLAMDTFPSTAMIMTASLDSIVTDSSPGMQNYVTGNKSANNQEGVWPDDTTDAFDNPRVEYLSEYLHRTQGKMLGLVTTADVFDATPAANAVHTSNREAGSGIVDQYLDDSDKTGLIVLMGGGRKWFLPNPTLCAGDTAGCGGAYGFNGSARSTVSDYVLPGELAAGWKVSPGARDPARDLLSDFQAAGWSYVPDATALGKVGAPKKLLGLFSLSNMNVALDKISHRRGSSSVVDDYGFPDQPMLDEMTASALAVMDANSPSGFVLMVEGASIDKQAHQMDSARWMLDVIEFDRSIKLAQDYAASHTGTLVLVTADHDCGGAVIIGGSKLPDAALRTALDAQPATTSLRDSVAGTYTEAKFPHYTIAADGYPTSTDVDRRLLIGYGAIADRNEDYRTRPRPTNDTQQPGNRVAPLSGYPRNNLYDGGTASSRPIQQSDGLFITGQVPGDQAVHTGGDIPLSAYGRGASLFGGTLDNTDVFFRLVQATTGGVRRRGPDHDDD
jgi:alkaline phosphatase